MSTARGEHFTLSWLSDPTVVAVNTLPPCSDHDFYATKQEAEEGVSSLVRSLDGVWKAHFAMNPAGAPSALLTGASMDGELREITVPCEFQLVNPDWDGPQYVNSQYPWDGHEELVPPQVSEEYNPTVTCVKTFSLSLKDMQHRIVLHLAGVEAAALVVVNGHEVGYTEDSFTSHAFNITPFVRVGENRLALRIFKRCSGSWLEDQDFWRWSGIHRSVSLHFWPETHLADLRVRTPLTDNYTTAHLETTLTIAGQSGGQARVTLAERSGEVLYEETKAIGGQTQVLFDNVVSGVKLWSAEEPNLYALTVTLTNALGRVTEVSRTMVGFRQFEMIDKIMCLNGKRIVFHGVNRHEFDCDGGRVVPYETLRKDIAICKSLNINAIRTSHYPNCTAFYRLCDEYGLYVIDETYPMYQGGFIWDYVDQGLRVTAPNGQERFAYGGDFGDRPTDWQFIGNGIVLADRTISAKGQEVRYLFRDVFLRPGKTGVTVVNRKQFAALKGYSLRWTVENDMMPVKAGEIILPEIAPGESRHINLPYGKLPAEGQVVLTCYLVLLEDQGILPAGTILSHGQTVYGEMKREEKPDCAPKPVLSDNNVGVRGKGLGLMFERGKGLISFRDKAGRETLLCQPQLSLFRAATDNDCGNGYNVREGVYHLISRYNWRHYAEVETAEGRTTITYRYGTPMLKDFEMSVVYTVRADDALDVTVNWPGVADLPDMPALGLSFQLDPRLDTVNYYGYGPEENYNDRREGAYLGWHSYKVENGMSPYLNPQESGNRGGVQSLSITDDEHHGVLVTGDALEISVQHWLPEQLAAARHGSDLMGPTQTVLDVAMFRKGVGGDDSWGAPTLPKYCYPADKPYSFTFTMKAL